MIDSLPIPPLLLWITLLIVSLTVLVKASDGFAAAAVRVGHGFGMPSFLIGVTIIAFGTSLPELVSSLIAVFRNAPEIVAGNVIGSNIANLLLVLGLVGVITGHQRLAYNILNVDLPFLAGSALFFALIAWNGAISVGEALLAIIGFVIYLGYALTDQQRGETLASDEAASTSRRKSGSLGHPVLILIITGVLIYVGAEFTVQSVIALADLVGLGTETIAASVVALGTSLPEVAVTMAAVRQGQPELAVGNVLGSNIFNSFAVVGLSGMASSLAVGPLVISPDLITFALPMMIVATLLAMIVVMEQELTKWEGWLLLLFYVFFLGTLFGLL